MRYRIAPIIAKTADEQRRFYTFFDDLEAAWKQEAEEWETIPPPPPPITEKWYKKLSTLQLFMLLTLLLLAMVGMAALFFSEEARFDLSIDEKTIPQSLKIGDTLVVNIQSERPDSAGFHWQLQDKRATVLEEQEAEQFNWIVDQQPGTYQLILMAPDNTNTIYEAVADTVLLTIQCAEPPKPVLVSPSSLEIASLVADSTIIFKIDHLPEGITAQWTFNSPYKQLKGQEVSHRFEGIGGEVGYTLKLINDAFPDYCYSIQEDRFSLGSDKAFMPLATFKKDDTPHISSKISWLYWFFALFPLIPAFLLYREWRKALRKQQEDKAALDAASELPILDAAPYFIPYKEQEEKIKVSPDFFRIARILRRREEGQRRTFAAKATIHATVKAGGYPSWRDDALTRPAEYLVLLPSREEGNQQDELLTRLVQFMQRRDAPLTAYYHDSGFRYCWQAGSEKTISLNQLHQRYPAHRLLILGNAHALVNPHASQQASLLKTVVRKLNAWPRRLILTTEPPIDWSFQEVLLNEHFRLYPISLHGITAGLEALDKDEDYQPPSFEAWQKKQQKIAFDNSYRYNKWETVEDHEEYLRNEPDSFRWLCALAVNARPDWALTIAIGQAIGVAVTHDRLLQLSRIPWLATNAPDNALRLELLRRLSKADEQLARQAVADELEQVKEQVADSFADSEWTANHALQQFALQPRAKENKQLISQLLNTGLLTSEQEAELDFIVQERIHKENEPLTAYESIDAWIKWEAPTPRLRLYLWLTTALCALAVGLLLYGGWYNSQRNNVVPDSYFYQAIHRIDSAQLVHNQAVTYLQKMEVLTTPVLITAHFDSVSWAKENLELSKTMRLPAKYPLADTNVQVLHYQFAALLLNSAHAISSEDSSYQAILQASYNGFNDLLAVTNLINERHLDALHGKGIAAWYLQAANDSLSGLLDTARMYYDSLLFYNNTYFDSIRITMPVNLETLLDRQRPRRYLHALLLDEQSRKPISNAVLKLANNQLISSNEQGIVNYDYAELTPQINATGQVGLEIEADGYRKKTYLMELFRTTNPIDTILLKPQGFTSQIRKGRVLDSESKQPIAGAKVQAMDANLVTNSNFTGLPFELTDSEGRYRVNRSTLTRTFTRQIQARITAEGYRDTIVRLRALEELPDVYLQAVEVKIEVFIDRDGDGIPDTIDQCPNTPEGAIVDDKGCEKIQAPAFTPPQMVRIAGGTFTMGCQNEERDGDCNDWEKPAHAVTLSTYYMGKTEVTNAEFAVFLNEKGNQEEGGAEWVNLEGNLLGEKCRIIKEGDQFVVESGYEKHPIIYVSWYGSRAFCAWLSEKTGQNYRLPTEAEWEYAARGGEQGEKDNFLYSGSDNIDEVAWYISNSGSRTHTVAGKKANQLGLYDMSGNVWEWCADWYSAYENSAEQNPKGPDTASERVYRGGGWRNGAGRCRVAGRNYWYPGGRSSLIGFRLAHSS